jgi:hypothetical protein
MSLLIPVVDDDAVFSCDARHRLGPRSARRMGGRTGAPVKPYLGQFQEG